MNDSSLPFRSATQLSQLLTQKKISACELLGTLDLQTRRAKPLTSGPGGDFRPA